MLSCTPSMRAVCSLTLIDSGATTPIMPFYSKDPRFCLGVPIAGCAILNTSRKTFHNRQSPQSPLPFMFSRLSQLARHLSRPLPNYAHSSAAFGRVAAMASSVSADERNTRTIRTAACLIIGDEVLGGKVCSSLPGYG